MPIHDSNTTNEFDNTVVTVNGATDNTPIGNVGDQVKIYASINPVPAQDVIYNVDNVLNGTNKSMDINGTNTPQNFYYTPTSGSTMFVESIMIMLEDGGTMDSGDFGAINGGLNNGVQILIKSKGVEYEICNLTDNMDIVTTFKSAFTPISDDQGNIRGMLDEEDVYVGILKFKTPIRINDSDSDYVRFHIRDNCGPLKQFEARIKAWRVI